MTRDMTRDMTRIPSDKQVKGTNKDKKQHYLRNSHFHMKFLDKGLTEISKENA